ncbi:NLRC5 [Branchiostoma lanceolatum]|uniref:NLRC5 protein n=1 Tax=Branchiostoma lanceolatum TaxID=7740 RepID=A0A8J9W541_BRALA|nr:NLRC5 [Branchiostoma lanceolatum]
MHALLRDSLLRNSTTYVDNLKNIEEVLGFLQHDSVLSKEEIALILSIPKTEDKVKVLLEILVSKDDRAFYVFRDALRKTGFGHLEDLLDDGATAFTGSGTRGKHRVKRLSPLQVTNVTQRKPHGAFMSKIPQLPDITAVRRAGELEDRDVLGLERREENTGELRRKSDSNRRTKLKKKTVSPREEMGTWTDGEQPPDEHVTHNYEVPKKETPRKPKERPPESQPEQTIAPPGPECSNELPTRQLQCLQFSILNVEKVPPQASEDSEELVTDTNDNAASPRTSKNTLQEETDHDFQTQTSSPHEDQEDDEPITAHEAVYSETARPRRAYRCKLSLHLKSLQQHGHKSNISQSEQDRLKKAGDLFTTELMTISQRYKDLEVVLKKHGATLLTVSRANRANSVTCLQRFQSQDDLEGFWQRYREGTVAMDMSRDLVSDDVCKAAKRLNLTVGCHMVEKEYQMGRTHFQGACEGLLDPSHYPTFEKYIVDFFQGGDGSTLHAPFRTSPLLSCLLQDNFFWPFVCSYWKDCRQPPATLTDFVLYCVEDGANLSQENDGPTAVQFYKVLHDNLAKLSGIGEVNMQFSATIKSRSSLVRTEETVPLLDLLLFMNHLKVLVLQNQRLADADVVTLSQRLSSLNLLEELDLTNNGLNDENIMELTHAFPHIPDLKVLKMTGNKATPPGTKHLIDQMSLLQHLDKTDFRVLNISGVHVSLEDATKMPHALRSMRNLTSVDLSACDLEDGTALTIIETLRKLPHVRSLNIRGNLITDKGMSAIFRQLRHMKALCRVDVSSNKMTTACLALLADHIGSFHELKELILLGVQKIEDSVSETLQLVLGFINGLEGSMGSGEDADSLFDKILNEDTDDEVLESNIKESLLKSEPIVIWTGDLSVHLGIIL